MARDPYEVVLADLRAKRDDIDRIIRSLEAFRPSPVAAASLSTPVAPLRPPSLGAGPYAGLSIVDASRAALKERGEPMGNPDLATALLTGGLGMNSAEPANTISSVLHRAWQAGGDVVKVGRGRWGLAEWFPGQDFSASAASKPIAGLPTQHVPHGSEVSWTPELVEAASRDPFANPSLVDPFAQKNGPGVST